MSSEEEYSKSSTSSDESYTRMRMNRVSRTKRRKLDNSAEVPKSHKLSFKPLFELTTSEEDDLSFEQIIECLLPEFLEERRSLQRQEAEEDRNGHMVRPLTRSETTTFIRVLDGRDPVSFQEAIISRKLKLGCEQRLAGISVLGPSVKLGSSSTPLPPEAPTTSINPQVLDALYSIRTTPYESSYLSRISGSWQEKIPGLMAVDWETQSPWMNLMTDIRAHFLLLHPNAEQPEEVSAPISYMSLQPDHLPQVHDLLARVFWSGINVIDALQYSPERCTVVATYKKMVVGAAFLSSPQETYITYLAVKAGWDNSQIATSMLYHLIMLNPNKDITLHVSTNNPAMILYNRFGFKAEEFVIGFYEDYLDPQSRASKNAFRLRLRPQPIERYIKH